MLHASELFWRFTFAGCVVPPGRQPYRSWRYRGRIFLHPTGDDLERPVGKWPLQSQGIFGSGRHPGLDFVGPRQDHRHRLGVDGADLCGWLRCQEREDVVGRLTFLDLPNGRPVSPDPGKAGKGSGLVKREPDVAAFGFC